MKEFIIAQNDAHQRVDKFIQKAVPALSQSQMYKYLRIKRIKLNGKRCNFSDRLNVGDKLQMYINDEYFTPPEYDFLSARDEVNVVFEDENVLIADKPSGLVVHADEQNSPDTLIGRILKMFYKRGEYNPEKENSFTPALCNRIDRNTSGLVICAKNAEALRELNEIIKHRFIEKRYLCVCFGKPPFKHAVKTAYHIKNEKTRLVKIYQNEVRGAKKIITDITVLKTSGELTLCEIELVTGRTHQIRAHMAFLGFPLLGDGKYGKNELNRRFNVKTQALHSYSVKFKGIEKFKLLNYLNEKEFKAEKPWFLKYF